MKFGENLQTARRALSRRGETVGITGKPFDALVYLEHAGTVVPREELANALWPSTVVEDNNLSQTILALRRVLDDAPDTRIWAPFRSISTSLPACTRRC